MGLRPTEGNEDTFGAGTSLHGSVALPFVIRAIDLPAASFGEQRSPRRLIMGAISVTNELSSDRSA